MDVSVIVVNWNVREKLRECLRSVFAQTGATFEVFVVDNASGDGSVEMVMKEFPQAVVIANTRNVGFATANNAALERATGEFVFLLNPDASLVGTDALMRMTECMRLRSKVGILGPRLIGDDGSAQASVRRFPTLWSQALIMLKLHHALRSSSALRAYFMDGFDPDEEASVDQVSGAAFLIRRALLDAIGTLDGGFFIWFEEVDYCKRARDTGWEVRYAPVATVKHSGGESFAKEMGLTKQRYFNDSLCRYMRKHHGVIAAGTVLLLSPLSLLLAWAAQTFKYTRSSYDYRS